MMFDEINKRFINEKVIECLIKYEEDMQALFTKY
jgi:hypothetical protein